MVEHRCSGEIEFNFLKDGEALVAPDDFLLLTVLGKQHVRKRMHCYGALRKKSAKPELILSATLEVLFCQCACVLSA